jgi:hypothetical protein
MRCILFKKVIQSIENHASSHAAPDYLVFESRCQRSSTIEKEQAADLMHLKRAAE